MFWLRAIYCDRLGTRRRRAATTRTNGTAPPSPRARYTNAYGNGSAAHGYHKRRARAFTCVYTHVVVDGFRVTRVVGLVGAGRRVGRVRRVVVRRSRLVTLVTAVVSCGTPVVGSRAVSQVTAASHVQDESGECALRNRETYISDGVRFIQQQRHATTGDAGAVLRDRCAARGTEVKEKR